MSDSGIELDKNRMETLLTELANRIYNLDPSNKYSFYIIGGAAMVMYYDCRITSRDIDVSWMGNSKVIDTAIEHTAMTHSINKAWINNDYEKSESYTKHIYNNSIHYSDILNCRFFIVRPELALCMKIIAFRKRKGKYDEDDADSMVRILRDNGQAVTMPIVIDWMETFYKPVPELRARAIGYLQSLGM